MKRINLQNAKAQIARPTTIRDINRQIVLSYVRDRGPISRAQIARETELHRSTVSLITDQLVNDGLIVETGEGESTGGRKPTLYKLMTGTPAAIGIDVGPKVVTIGVSDLAGNLLSQESFASSPDLEFMTAQIIERTAALAKIHNKYEIEIGISVPGLVDQRTGRVIHIPYFNWRDWDINSALRRATGLTVTVENDANATALAELWFSRDALMRNETFVSVLVGDGIGTGIVFDGQLYRGEMGAGGEFGHMIAGSDAPVECSCGSRECWEAYASEKALIERYRRLLELNGLKANGFDVSDIVQLARSGEVNAVKALRETVEYLGNGISNLIVGLSPQIVVVSGRITDAWSVFEDILTKVSERSILAGLPKTRLVPSALGSLPTLKGAFCLVLSRKFGIAG
jgi:predicted NBD/HSP70 family sugar kinase